jgi:hypothetical protein
MIVTAGDRIDKKIKFWSIPTGKLLFELKGPHLLGIKSLVAI